MKYRFAAGLAAIAFALSAASAPAQAITYKCTPDSSTTACEYVLH